MRRAVPLLVLLTALPAVAQKLALINVRSSQDLGMVGQPLRVQRQDSLGAPLTGPALMVTLNAGISQAQFSLSNDPANLTNTWSSMLNVTIANGASDSAPIYFRSGSPGVVTLTASASAFTADAKQVTVSRRVIRATYEGGALFVSDAGAWNDSWLPSTINTISGTTAAAHSGSWGLRVDDTENVTGANGQNAIYAELAPITGAVFFRTWFRLTTSNAQGSFVLGQLAAQKTNGSPNLVELAVRGNNRTIVIEGFNSGPAVFQVQLDAGIGLATWHLIEMAALGTGSFDGGRRAWVDGQQIYAQDHIDWHDYPVERATVGEPWSADRRFTGQLDFDDTWVTIDEPPSALTLTPVATSGPVGACVGVDIALSSSAGTTGIAAPFSFSGSFVATGVQLFSDGACSQPAPTYSVNQGATTTRFFVQSMLAGPHQMTVNHSDFLSGSAVFTALDGGVLDAGSLGDAGNRLDGGTGLLPDGGIAAPVFVTVPSTSVSCADTWTYQPMVVALGTVTWEAEVTSDAGTSGFTFQPDTGNVAWTFARMAPASRSLTLTATNSGGAATQNVEIDVTCDPARLSIGCGCNEVSFSSLLALSLVTLALKRRRMNP